MLRTTSRLALLLAGLVPAAAGATTIHVDSTEDAVLDDGNCTLREALLAASSLAPVDGCPGGSRGTNEIVLPPGHFVLGAAGPLVIGSQIDIRGGGTAETVLDGNLTGRVFDVLDGGARLRLSDVTVTGGRAPTSDIELEASGGAIRARGELRVERSRFVDNRAGNGSAGSRGGHGGAIYGTGPMQIVDSAFESNAAGNGGTPINFEPTEPGSGGAIYATGTVLIERARFVENEMGRPGNGLVVLANAGAGAAVASFGPLTLREVAFDQNGRGYAARHGTVFAGAGVRAEQVSFRGNRAANGSALYAAAGGTLVNATVVDNSAWELPGELPGAAVRVAGGEFRMHSVTLVGNHAGGLSVSGGTALLRNSIVAGNQLAGTGTADCRGSDAQRILTRGNNLFTSSGGCPAGAHDVVAAGLGLGSARTMAGVVPAFMPLHAASPAVDNGSCVEIDAADEEVTADIRGMERPVGRGCDIGAFEYREAQVLFRTEAEAPGENCPAGGTRISIGVDDDTDGVLGEDEVRTEAFVCNGASGEPGEPGLSCTVEQEGADAVIVCEDGTRVVVPAGVTALLRLSDEPAGAQCEAGGVRIETGLDRNRNGVLDDEEVDSVGWVCAAVESGTGGSGGTGGTGGTGGGDPACTVEQTADGGALITCPDGTSTTIRGPRDGARGADGGCSAAGGGTALLGLAFVIAAARRRR